MKSYLKLVNFEINRFFKLYLIIIVLTIVSQLIGTIIVSKGKMNDINQVIYENQLSMSQYIDEYGTFSFQRIVYSELFVMPIFFCIAMLMIYVFFIWYRDWFGKNTFIYRLFMLPTERITVYFSKLSAIMLFVLGLISLQIILIPIEMFIFNSIVPADFRTSYPLFDFYSVEIWRWLYPSSVIEFILMYGMGLILVVIIFTAILFERSYGLKGIFAAIVYGVLSFGVLFSPIIIARIVTGYFYPLEILLMELVTSIIVLGSAFWIANHLLKYKIRV
ncbi:hypothetical protein ACIQXW_04305 [Lysinibacillus sp. NPDC097162]|uniref:hypothetical protein n=1 Tax=Lysinibacillus sp. NPDC097162 TaxID=3364140 RepID=UPI003828836B